jgi:large subunit ribosomal protein L18
MLSTKELILRRRIRQRFKLKNLAQNQAQSRLRLSIHRTNLHTYAQIIDDEKGETLVSASTITKESKETLNRGSNISASIYVGKLIAEKALALGINQVVFDRSGFLYHGRVKALADSARENGLSF